MNCSSCGTETDRQKAFELGDGRILCADCFVKKAESRRDLTGEDRKRLKEAVKREMDGLLPRDRLKEIIEECCAAVLQREEPEEAIGRAVNEIERIAGLALCRQTLEILSGIGKAIETEETSIREKIRKIGAL